MASLSITNDEIYSSVGTLLGISRDNADWDATTTADVDRVIRQGRRKFFSAHRWSFLETDYRILTAVPFEAGTVAVVDGVVTKTGGANFPTDATLYKFVSGDDGVFDIASRDSNSQLTLVDTSLDVTAGSSYAMYKWKYALPTNFGAFLAPVTVENNIELQECYSFPDFTLRAVGNLNRPTYGQPKLFSVVHEIADDEIVIPVYYLTVWPLPDEVFVLNTKIRIQPGDSLDETDSTAIFHPVYAGLMLEAVLAEAEVMYNGERGVHFQAFQDMLPDYVRKDNAARGVRRLLPRLSTEEPGYEYKTATVTWEV